MAVALEGLRYRWPGQKQDAFVIEALRIARGEKVFLAGSSGSGKSTLLSLIGGIVQPQQGRLSVLGQELTGLSARRRDRFRADHLGIIFQQFNLVPYLSVHENVVLALNFSALKRRQARREQAGYWLEKLGLARSLWERPARELSVGQQQRVAGARALMGAPQLIIADEPTSSLDVDNQQAFIEALLGCTEETGASVLFVSHDRRLAVHFDRELSLTALNRAGGES